MPLDLLIRRATLPGRMGHHEIFVDGGRIAAIEPTADGSGLFARSDGAVQVMDANGYLVLEGAVDGHLHLDKSLAGANWRSLPQARDWREKSRLGEAILDAVTEPGLEERILRQARRLVDRGTVTARTHATVTLARGLTGVEASLRTRERMAGVLDLQVVAFPQYGTGADGMEELLAEAMRLGCDVVGGNDPATYDQDIEGQLRTLFEVAVKYRAPIDIHLHDNGHLGRFEIERFCTWTIAEGIQGLTSISHALALGDLDPDDIGPAVDLLAAADVAVIVPGNPDVSIAPIALLEAAGVRVGLGSDAAHSVLPFGTGDMFRKANLVAQRNIVTSDDGLARLWERVTRDTAGILGHEPAVIAPGSTATFLLVRARNVAEAIASPPADRVTFVGGRAVGSMGDGLRLVAT